MTDENSTPEDEVRNADDLHKSEKQLGTETRKLMEQQEELTDKHIKNIADIHAVIIKVGIKLQAGREIYQFDNVGFNSWIQFNRLDSGRIYGGSTGQQERTAAMTIARLHEEGYAENDEAVPEKLDLAGCERVRPTDIIKWARKKQPQLFPKMGKPPGKKKPLPKLPDDEIPDLTGEGGDDIGEAQWISNLKAENKRLRDQVAALTLEKCIIMALDRLEEIDAMSDDNKADLLDRIEELHEWASEYLTTTGELRWYTDEGGWYYDHPDGPDASRFCIETERDETKKDKAGRPSGSLTGYYRVSDGDDDADKFIYEHKTLDEAKAIVQAIMDREAREDAANNTLNEIAAKATGQEHEQVGKQSIEDGWKEFAETSGLPLVVAKREASAKPAAADDPDQAKTLLGTIGALLEDSTWQHADGDGEDARVELGEHFLELEKGILAIVGPKPADASKRKTWQAKVDKAWEGRVAALLRRPRCPRTFSYKAVKLCIKAAQAARKQKPEPQPAAAKLTWSGDDATGWVARTATDLLYEVKRTTASGSKWNVVVYEDGAAQGQSLSKKPYDSVGLARAAVEADYAERAG